MSTTTKQAYTLFYSNSSPFSNWYMSDFKMDSLKFNCSEQAMMYLKAKLFKDDEAANKVMAAKTPKEQKIIGRSVKNFDQTVWEENRDAVMDKILLAKFSSSDELKEVLLETEGTRCVECSRTDIVWGIGFGVDDPESQDETQWRGLNLLGKSLDRVRETLK